MHCTPPNKHCIASRDITSRYMTLHYNYTYIANINAHRRICIISHHIKSFYTKRDATPHCITSHRTTSQPTPHHITSHHITPRYRTSHHTPIKLQQLNLNRTTRHRIALHRIALRTHIPYMHANVHARIHACMPKRTQAITHTCKNAYIHACKRARKHAQLQTYNCYLHNRNNVSRTFALQPTSWPRVVHPAGQLYIT